MNDQPKRRADRTAWLAVGGVLFAVVCCAGPALIAGGVLASVAGFLTGGYVIGLGVLIAAIGLVIAINRRKTPCPPGTPREARDTELGRRGDQ